MNGKQAKKLRRYTESLMRLYVKDRLLMEHQLEGLNDKRILDAVPDVSYNRHLGTIKCGILTKRWFNKQVKENPNVSYEELLKSAGLA